MARWNELSCAQREAILAFTREAPSGEPNGAAEASWEEVISAAIALPPGPLTDRLMLACGAACAALADQVRALRLAFDLDEDGITPKGKG